VYCWRCFFVVFCSNPGCVPVWFVAKGVGASQVPRHGRHARSPPHAGYSASTMCQMMPWWLLSCESDTPSLRIFRGCFTVGWVRRLSILNSMQPLGTVPSLWPRFEELTFRSYVDLLVLVHVAVTSVPTLHHIPKSPTVDIVRLVVVVHWKKLGYKLSYQAAVNLDRDSERESPYFDLILCTDSDRLQLSIMW
jgi:hypothetical protein